MSEVLQVARLPGYPDEIARWLWAMQATWSRTLELVEGLDQATLDWEGTDGRDNAIGTLLYHIALVEMSWLYLDIIEEEFPPKVKNDFPFDMGSSKVGLHVFPMSHWGNTWVGLREVDRSSSMRFAT